MRLYGRFQVIRDRGHYIGWDRACPSDSQEAILARARDVSLKRADRALEGWLHS